MSDIPLEASMRKTVLPGGRIGILGGGQLGMMFIESAQKMGYRVHVFSPDADAPACKLADRVTVGLFDDVEALKTFARSVEVVTLEFENIPRQAVEVLEHHTQMYPGPNALITSQNRIEEKTFFQKRGYSVPPFEVIKTPDDLTQAVHRLGYPSVLKTTTMGYDGKGQQVLFSSDDLSTALNIVGPEGEWILEKFIDFEAECSVVAVRGHDGSMAHLGVFQNFHEKNILDVTVSAGAEMDDVEKGAIETTFGLLKELDMVGIVCLEFFITKDKQLLVNEMAPRPHNSGHISMETHRSSQFDLHVRAVCGLPLGDTSQVTPGAMANIMGDLWVDGQEPDWRQLDAFPGVKLYLYGKAEARPGRKMGHISVIHEDPFVCLETIRAARKALIRVKNYGPC